MDEATVARATTRCERGIELWRNQGESIERTGPSSYQVPSCSSGETYNVELSLGYCSCPDRERAKLLNVACKHVIAAAIARAKTRKRK